MANGLKKDDASVNDDANDEPSELDQIRNDFQSGKLKPLGFNIDDKGNRSASQAGKDAMGVYKRAHEKVAVAEQALEKIKEEEDATVLQLARLFCGESIPVNGVVHDFASRGGRVFFRRKKVVTPVSGF